MGQCWLYKGKELCLSKLPEKNLKCTKYKKTEIQKYKKHKMTKIQNDNGNNIIIWNNAVEGFGKADKKEIYEGNKCCDWLTSYMRTYWLSYITKVYLAK